VTSLTPRQRTVLAAIATLTERQGYPPSHREIAPLVGIGISTINYHLLSLTIMGLVDWEPWKARTLHLTAAGKEALG